MSRSLTAKQLAYRLAGVDHSGNKEVYIEVPHVGLMPIKKLMTALRFENRTDLTGKPVIAIILDMKDVASERPLV